MSGESIVRVSPIVVILIASILVFMFLNLSLIYGNTTFSILERYANKEVCRDVEEGKQCYKVIPLKIK